MSSRESIIAALLASLSPLTADVVRDADIPETIPPAGLVIIRSAAPEVVDQTLGPVQSWYMTLNIPIEAYIAGGDAATRATRIDALLSNVYSAVTSDLDLAVLSSYLTMTMGEIETVAPDGAPTVVAAQMTAQVEYDCSTSIG